MCVSNEIFLYLFFVFNGSPYLFLLDFRLQGYSFPTNLDRDQPLDGELAPPTQARLVTEALSSRMSPEELDATMKEHESHRRTV